MTIDEIDKFSTAKKETGISRIISHASYLINIASNDKEKFEKSKNALENELIRSSKLGIESVVLHPGSHLNQGEKNGIEIVVGTINSIYSGADNISARLILETTAGQGTNLGYQFEQLAEMIDNAIQKHFDNDAYDSLIEIEEEEGAVYRSALKTYVEAL